MTSAALSRNDPLWQRMAVGALLPIALLIIWQIVGMSFGTPRTPLPTRIVEEAGVLISSGELTSAILQSLRRVLSGFLIASLIAIPLGLLMGYARAVERNLEIAGPGHFSRDQRSDFVLSRQIAQNAFWTLRHEKRQMLDGHNLPYTQALRREREESPGRSPDFADRLKAVKARLARPAA